MQRDMIFDDGISVYKAVSNRDFYPQTVPGPPFQSLWRCADRLEANTDTADELFVFLHNIVNINLFQVHGTKGDRKKDITSIFDTSQSTSSADAYSLAKSIMLRKLA